MQQEPVDDAVVPTYTAGQVRAAERPSLAAGVPLMERAAGALAQIAAELLDRRVSGHEAGRDVRARAGRGAQPARPRALILAGSGDNGGDALFAAATLTGRADVDVLPVSSRRHEAGLAAATGAGARLVDLSEALTSDYDLVVDGILGIGASADPALRGHARETVLALLPRVANADIVAVDLPSGLHPDTGAADEAVLPATATVTFGAVKHGLTVGEGPRLRGELVLVRIGIEQDLAADAVGSARVDRVLDAPAGLGLSRPADGPRALVVYETIFGNTGRIAQAVAQGLSDGAEVAITDVAHAPSEIPPETDLLVVGGPTHVFSMSRSSTRQEAVGRGGADDVLLGIREWIRSLPREGRRQSFVAFDTRVDLPIDPGAASRVATRLAERRGFVVGEPESFIVTGYEGPLVDGEIERARAWGRRLARELAG